MTDGIPTYAVVPSAGRDCLYDCLNAVRDQVDGVVVVVNGGYNGTDLRDASVMRDASPVPNISRWWNIGLDAVARRAEDREQSQWNVLVLNDDTVMGSDSVARLAEGLNRQAGAQLAFPGSGPVASLLTGPNDVRITGWCFMLRGEGGLRTDEELAWWCGDNDLDWRARAAGGTVVVPGVDHQHLYPNGYTVSNPELTAQAGRDMARFVEKWGRPAW